MKLAVVIPSVGRPAVLSLALRAIQDAGSCVSEVIVVCREDDSKTQHIAQTLGAKLVIVDRPGLAWAMQQGALATNCDVVAFTDDDARVRPGWAESLLAHYKADVGGVGGRDEIEGSTTSVISYRQNSNVGMVGRFGQVHGGHHLGTGASRFVHHLKGVNCSFRREVFTQLEFQELIHGSGAQTRNEFVASLGVRHMGFKLVYDPELIVDHSPAPRVSGEKRNGSTAKLYESAYNERLGFRLYDKRKSLLNAIYIMLIGYRHAPGVLRLLRSASITEISTVWRAVLDSQRLNKGILSIGQPSRRNA